MGKTMRVKDTVCSLVVCALGLFVVLCSMSLNRAWGSKADAAVSEYEVKAAFLLNFIRFVEWPDERTGEAGDELVLCIVGKDPFGKALDLIKGRTVRGRTLVIKDSDEYGGFADCHILFVPASEEDRLAFLMRESRDLPILTVGEIAGFAQGGGVINFITVKNRIRFEINPDAAKRAGIHISSQLLKLAQIVRGL